MVAVYYFCKSLKNIKNRVMKYNRKLVFATMLAACTTGFVACDDDDDNKDDDSQVKYFATTDMTWQEFFQGEIGDNAAQIDAFTSATRGKAARFTACVVEDSSIISGVKAVNVGMTEKAYKSLTEAEKSRFTFLADTTLSVYKKYDSSRKFGASNNKVAKEANAQVSLTCGDDAKWGDYVLSISGLNATTNITTDRLQGVVVTAKDGKKYGLIPLNNLWLKSSEMAFCVKSFTEPHGNKPAFAQTKSLEGNTITNITYLLKDTSNISVDLNLFVKLQSDATVEASAVSAGSNPEVTLTVKGAKDDANYTFAVAKKGSGKKAVALAEGTDFTYSNGKAVIKGDVAAGDVFTFSFESDKYVSKTATVTVQ